MVDWLAEVGQGGGGGECSWLMLGMGLLELEAGRRMGGGGFRLEELVELWRLREAPF